MSFRKVIAWFATDSGKAFNFGAAVTCTMGTFCCYYVPHTFLLSEYKEIVHLYRNGMTVPVPKQIQERFVKALDLAEISEFSKRIYSSFSVIGFDIFSAGSTFSRYGSIIGLPINFTYTNADTIDKTSIKILGESVVWESTEAKSFLNSLVLSEKAQTYAIAREIRMTDTLKLPLDSFWATFSAFLAYSVSHVLNSKCNMFAKPVQLRMIMYSLVGTFVLTNYFFVKDFMQLYYEHEVDEELKHLSPYLREGAIEFYTKMLERNKALRKLMGAEGEAMYSVLGNENYFLRQKHLPLVQRKAYYESNLTPEESLVKNVL